MIENGPVGRPVTLEGSEDLPLHSGASPAARLGSMPGTSGLVPRFGREAQVTRGVCCIGLKPIDRSLAAQLGRDTLHILRTRSYTSPSGRHVNLAAHLDQCVTATVEYPPGSPEEGAIRARHGNTAISVENRTVLDVGRRMAKDGPVAALNFAAATQPGGGFLSGARAQEESLARSSGLYACLEGREMYAYHLARLDAMYADWVIYSPDVPVFRTDEGDLLEEPWLLTILTCPAVNGRALQHYEPDRMRDVPEVMTRRTAKVLSVAETNGVRRFILGAWGCGAFGLDPMMMATIFRDALAGPFHGAFDEIVFAVTDWSDDEHFTGPFKRLLTTI